MPAAPSSNILGRIFGRVFGRWFTGRGKRPNPAWPALSPPARPVMFRGPGSAPVERVAGDPPTGSRGWTFPPIPVDSSNLDRVAYDYDTRTLEVCFLGKGTSAPSVYHYDGVPVSVYQGLMGAASKGTYLHQHVKTPKGRYPYRKVL